MNEEKQPKRRGRPPKVVQQVKEEVIPDVPEAPMRALVVGLLPNPTWVRGRIDGFGVNIKCPSQLSKRLLGKEISVTLIKSEPEDYYQYLA